MQNQHAERRHVNESLEDKNLLLTQKYFSSLHLTSEWIAWKVILEREFNRKRVSEKIHFKRNTSSVRERSEREQRRGKKKKTWWNVRRQYENWRKCATHEENSRRLIAKREKRTPDGNRCGKQKTVKWCA